MLRNLCRKNYTLQYGFGRRVFVFRNFKGPFISHRIARSYPSPPPDGRLKNAINFTHRIDDEAALAGCRHTAGHAYHFISRPNASLTVCRRRYKIKKSYCLDDHPVPGKE
jgi:hypothetical protein